MSAKRLVAILGTMLAMAGVAGAGHADQHRSMMGPESMGRGDCPGDPGMMTDPGMESMMMQPGMRSPGMMMGPGMGPYSALDLTKEQRSQLAKIRQETRKKHWDLMGKVHEERDTLAELMDADPRDPAAIGSQYRKIQELQRHMLESSIEAQNRIEGVLTPAQREKVREWRRHRMAG